MLIKAALSACSVHAFMFFNLKMCRLPFLPLCCWSGRFWTLSSSWLHRLRCESSSAQRDSLRPTLCPPPSPAGTRPPASGRPTTAPVCPHRAAKAPQRSRGEAAWTEMRREQTGGKERDRPSTCTEKGIKKNRFQTEIRLNKMKLHSITNYQKIWDSTKHLLFIIYHDITF